MDIINYISSFNYESYIFTCNLESKKLPTESVITSYSIHYTKLYEFGDADIEECKDVVKAFAQYTARLHEAGILHRDYSPGNILFDKIDGEYQFSLVDINRMSFGVVDISYNFV